jgi:hypothetical protein
MSVPNITAYVKNSFTFLKSAYYIYVSILTVFCRFFTCIALGDADLRVSLSFIPKAYEEGGVTRDAYLYHQHNQSIHVTGGMTVTSLSVSPNKRQVQPHHLCQITLNQKLSDIVYAKLH